MREIDSYKGLKEAVQLWLNRKDQATVNNIPAFINFAEKDFTRFLRLPYYENEIRYLITTNTNNFLELPQDFLSARSFLVNGRAMTHLDPESFHRQRGKTADDNTHPKYWTRIGWKIITWPALSVGDELSLLYHQDIPEMKEDNDRPYSLIVAPDVLLYLTLRHASIFLRDNEQEQYWMSKATEAVTLVSAQLDEAEWSGNSLAVQQYEMN